MVRLSAKDLFHDTVKSALQKEGWMITDDPLYLRLGDDQLRVDLGVPKQNIVLAYHSLFMRQYDGFAVS